MVIVVAVKPQAMDEVFPPLAKIAGPETVVMSIAAGKTIASFERYLPAGTAVVRAMPNTPAAIGRGITGAVATAIPARLKGIRARRCCGRWAMSCGFPMKVSSMP